MKTQELLPCPMCGGQAHIARECDEDGFPWRYVKCDKCGLRTRGNWASSDSNICGIFLSEIRNEWNRRAIADQLAGGGK